MKTTPPESPALAYSYIRFSHPDQAKGDSLRRQTEAAVQWCQRNGVNLDTSTTLRDLGKSAFTGEHRKNPDRHALAAFLKLVEAGKIPRGSYLVIENLDRLSREDEVPACHLLTGILMDGIKVVQLSPYEMLLTEKSNGWELMRAVMELSRGHGESAMKSERVGKAWQDKKRNGREHGVIITRRLPAWIQERGGKLHLIPERAAVVRRIFELAIGGYGLSSIVKRFTEEGVPPFGKVDRWVRSYIAHILKDRRALGECQPRLLRDGKPDGEPIPNYFPAVVNEEQWHAARAGAAQRRHKPGRLSSHVNIFSCLLRHARDGDTVCTATQKGRRGAGQGYSTIRVLRNKASMEGRAPCSSFPFDVFERAILDKLAEIDAHAILNGDSGPDESLVLAGQLERVEASIALIEADMNEHGESPVLFRRLRVKEEEKKELAARLAEAQQRAAHPLSKTWGECQSLLAILDAAPDPEDVRLRLRAALRRMVDSIWLLVVARGRDRLAAVQVWFAGGERCRSYLILHRPPRANDISRQEAKTWCRSFADTALPDDFDLRRKKDAKELERVLLAIDVAALAE